MSELSCSANQCSYNQEHYCCKGDIYVGGRHASKKDDTCCESFRNRTDYNTESSKELGAFHTGSTNHPSRIIYIDCEADNCKYNSDYKCIAQHVDIAGSTATKRSATNCSTFSAK